MQKLVLGLRQVCIGKTIQSGVGPKGTEFHGKGRTGRSLQCLLVISCKYETIALIGHIKQRRRQTAQNHESLSVKICTTRCRLFGPVPEVVTSPLGAKLNTGVCKRVGES
jgi:hypothetical protein